MSNNKEKKENIFWNILEFITDILELLNDIFD